MSTSKQSSIIRNTVCSLIVGAALVAAAGVFLAQSTIQTALRDEAIRNAVGWGTYLTNALPDIEAIAAGARPGAESQLILKTSREVGDIFRYKIFDRDGRLAFVSDDPGYRMNTEQALLDHNPKAARVLETLKPFVDVETGDGESRPLHYSEAYVPLIRGEAIVGTVEVYVDQTSSREALIETFRGIAAKLVGGLALAFGIPAAGFYIRTRQQERTLGELEHTSQHDDLTGQMNRSSFVKAVERLIVEGAQLSIHFLDLDRFKSVNDTLGHSAGDALLREMSVRLKELVGANGFIGRVGGDEFAICDTHSRSTSELSGEFAEAVVAEVSRPYLLNGHTVQIGCSVGFAVHPEHGSTADELLKAADIALYRAKTTGRGCSQEYRKSMEEELRLRREMETLLQSAISEDLLELHFQPLFATREKRLIGFEALLRLRDRNGNMIPPAAFITIAEDIGLIKAIGDWVLVDACSFAATWPEDLAVAVNLSAAQFETGDLVEVVSDVLKKTGLRPSRLELEVTESLLIGDPEAALSQLERLRKIGVRIALDDFGTGYSSLSYLWRFPFDKLKIDRSFMAEAENECSKSYGILRSIVSLGKTLNLSITAEGVETDGQLAKLRDLQCDQSQGYLLGRPMPKEDLARFVLNCRNIRQTPLRKSA
ncbi:MAG: EAL domain-containing protein [Rhizobiaceae bacterium]|nr:EAL domain-containing protein [Rhizobiaceae bacterium]